MTKIVELDPVAHAKHRIAEDSDAQFARHQHVMFIRAGEVARAACEFPVFCSRSATTGTWSISAMTSLEANSNLSVVDGNWTAIFEPSAMRSYPLCLVNSPENTGQFALGIDATSSSLGTDHGNELFDDNGNPTIFLSKIKTMLEADIEADIQTRYFLDELVRLELLKPLQITVAYEDDASQTIVALHSIDEDKLQSLASEELVDLLQKGYLATIHAMLISLYQLNSLVRRHNSDSGRKQVSQVKLNVARAAGEAGEGLQI